MAFYRRNLPHLQQDAKPHFLTFCTYKRWPIPDDARSTVLESCVKADQWSVDLWIAIVMPDHVHLIFTPRTDEVRHEVYTLARITKAIKAASAHRINRELGRTGRIWQEESFDHVLRSSENLNEKIQYILQNPVRKGLVAAPEEYPWLWIASCYAHLLRSHPATTQGAAV